ncbi:flagellar motor protein MotA [Alcaligenes faecalis]|uniref:MotA/TolQ/ExbB proton channel family protein n=1 Tax=Alcaligenes faecalis TaxID=511 RepID=UPI000A2D6ED4|nr:MotA/TolQ/ExbB proton channel family protein [Alcaligenes faecalis]KAA1286743.1 MotA/TolQ/ExbB proton channel family protein [Alcaligenes faecalis]OSZ36085.1 flagellar motor protein MotA [Alcaligenes faecalis]OSZ47358.1 flagellar motor protein MotA [Alcaligenes faecalis]
MLTLIHAAGWPVWFLLACSILALGLILERLLALRSKRILPPGLARQISELTAQNRIQDDSLPRLYDNSPLGRVLATVLKNRHLAPALRESAVEAEGKDISYQLNKYIPALGTIAVIAPLLGLFGTVIGMIDIFAAYDPAGGDPSLIARGISVALYNTALGILIAVPAMIFHRYFRSRADYLLHCLETEAGALDRLLAQRAA